MYRITGMEKVKTALLNHIEIFIDAIIQDCLNNSTNYDVQSSRLFR